MRLPLLATLLMWTAMAMLCPRVSSSEEVTARLRIAWGAGPQAPQAWSGAVEIPGATITEMRPIGVESDEAAALRVSGDRIEVAPIVPRAFDGCDVTVRADASAAVNVRLVSTSTELKVASVPLGDLLMRPFSAPLDQLGGYVLIDRAPGDRLRVRLDRDHLVFSPSEPFKLAIEPDFAATSTELSLSVQLQAATGGRVLWEKVTPIESPAKSEVEFDVPTPAIEGAYRLGFVLRGREGFASKLTPWQTHPPLASRVVEFVVIDPAVRLPRITADLQLVQSIDVANPKWYQRVPEWAQLDRLPVLGSPRPLGNVKLEPRQIGDSRFVALPPPASGAELSWQAYPLSVREIGQPHVVEIDLAADASQQLAVSLLEPDAAGRVMSFGREAGVYLDGSKSTKRAAGGVVKHRIAFWPRTATPVLLLANQSRALPATYGMIRVWRRQVEPVIAVAATAQPQPNSESPSRDAGGADRLVAAYVSLPQFTDCLGGAESYDEAGRLSVKGWTAFLEGINRLAQQLQSAGYNAAILSTAAHGSSLAPLESLGASPRHDTGRLAANGADPLPKDVLEALLRVFDREGIHVIPAIELATPLPALEALRHAEDAPQRGIECILSDGRTWGANYPGGAAGAHYNILNRDVQQAVAGIVQQLTDRYGAHASWGGVALQLSGHGFGVLPNSTAPLDDASVERFITATGRELPRQGDDRYRERAQLVSTALRSEWLAWRQRELTAFYRTLGEQVRGPSGERRLVLCTEDLYAGTDSSLVLRRSLGGRAGLSDAARQVGVDLDALAEAPGVCLLRARRLASDDALEQRAIDLVVNNAPESDRLEGREVSLGELLYHESQRVALPSFDAQSPFGPGTTRVAMTMASYPGGDAARQTLATILASHDASVLVEGGELLPLVVDDAVIPVRRLLQRLPRGDAAVKTESKQPVTLRVYRTADATVLALINDAPWETAVEVPVDASIATSWVDLADEAAVATNASSKGVTTWKVSLPPHGVVARRYATPDLKIGSWSAAPESAAKADLAASIREIESRMHSLDIERPYPQLHNADFELAGPNNLIAGWQPRIGKSGRVEAGVDRGASKSLHLTSEDGLGVAAQSQRFPIPATGQVTVRARVRGGSAASTARMYVWVECDPSVGLQPTHVPKDEGLALSDDWTTHEFVFDELPMASSAQMKIQFHLVGVGEAWVDDVELFDLRFSPAQRNELAKRVLGAKMALEEGQLVDCQRLLNDYWPRYLVANLPATPITPVGPSTPSLPDVRVATKPDDVPAAPETRTPGFGERVRSIFR